MIIPHLGAIKMAVCVIVGAAIGHQIGLWQGDKAGYDRRVAEVAAATVRAEIERKGDDALLQGKSDYDLCILGLSTSRMPTDVCEQLRGVGKK